MRIYNYSKETFEYLSISTARENPLEEGKYLIPAYATNIAPPSVEKNEVAVFDRNCLKWSIKVDYRRQTFWDIQRNTHEITKIGVEPEDDWLTEEPSFTEKELTGQFVDKQKNMIFQLKQNANSIIESRFPQYHQINLLDGTKEDIPDGWDKTNRVSEYNMVKKFKQNIIEANNEIEANIAELYYPNNTIEELKKIGINEDNIKVKAGY